MSVLIFKAQNRRDRSQKIRFPDGAAFKNYRIGGIYPFLDHGNHGVDLGAAQFIDFKNSRINPEAFSSVGVRSNSKAAGIPSRISRTFKTVMIRLMRLLKLRESFSKNASVSKNARMPGRKEWLIVARPSLMISLFPSSRGIISARWPRRQARQSFAANCRKNHGRKTLQPA